MKNLMHNLPDYERFVPDEKRVVRPRRARSSSPKDKAAARRLGRGGEAGEA